MAKAAATAPTTAAPKPAARVFTFDAQFSVPIPEIATKAPPRANALPFKGLFTQHEQAAMEGKQPHIFVPHEYWKTRTDKPENVDDAYAKGKLRGQFNDWVKENVLRQSLKLIIVARTGKEQGFTEPGVSIWLDKQPPK
jgi:hypothetical protein